MSVALYECPIAYDPATDKLTADCKGFPAGGPIEVAAGDHLIWYNGNQVTTFTVKYLKGNAKTNAECKAPPFKNPVGSTVNTNFYFGGGISKDCGTEIFVTAEAVVNGRTVYTDPIIIVGRNVYTPRDVFDVLSSLAGLLAVAVIIVIAGIIGYNWGRSSRSTPAG
jgi:hypothetical protein